MKKKKYLEHSLQYKEIILLFLFDKNCEKFLYILL